MSTLAGNPVALQRGADTLVASAKEILAAADDLRALAYESDSLAVSELRSQSTDLSLSMGEAHQRYRGTGVALQEYAVSLKQAHAKADAAAEREAQYIRNAGDAQAMEVQSRRRYESLRDADMPMHLIAEAEREVQYAMQRTRNMQQLAGSAAEEIEQARRDVDAAARHAIAQINDAIRHTNDSMGDKIKRMLDTLAKALDHIAAWVGSVLKKVLDVILEVLAVVVKALLIIVAILLIIAVLVVAVKLILAIVATALFKIIATLVITLVAASLIKDHVQTVDVSEFSRDDAQGINADSVAAYDSNKVAGSKEQRDVMDLYQSIVNVDLMGQTDAAVLDIKQMPGDPPTWVVTIPSTQDFFGSAPNDWWHNIALQFGSPTAYERAVMQAMRDAGISPTDRVMMQGFSQGGIMAARLAANSSSGFNITQVLTVGSPVTNINIPHTSTAGDPVRVLSIEHATDPVPKLHLKHHDPNSAHHPNWNHYHMPDQPGHTNFDSHNAEMYKDTLDSIMNGSGQEPGIGNQFNEFLGKPDQHVTTQIRE